MSSNSEADSLATLAECGVVKEGTIVELVPFTWPLVPLEGADALFKAVVVNPQGGEDALRWPMDGQRYSAQALLSKLEQDYGVCGIPIVYRNWRIVGHEESIWREANRSVHNVPSPLKGVGTPESEAGMQVDQQRRPSAIRRILIVSARVFIVALASALGAKFGGWIGGGIAATIAGSFAVATAIRSDGGSQEQHC